MNKLKISNKQRSLLSLFKSKKHLIVFQGAFRSGKTLFGSFGFAEMMIKMVTQENHQVKGYNRFAIVGQASVKETHDNVTKSIVTWLRYRGWDIKAKNYDYICSKGQYTIYIDGYSINNKASYKRLQGGTFRGIFLDEAPLMNSDAVETAIGRCGNFEDYKIVMTGNPEGTTEHWFYKSYLNNNDEVLNIHFELLDNPVFNEDNLNWYKKIFTKTMFERKVLGLWVASSGQCYPMLPQVKTCDDKFDFINIGIDYGESDATTCVAVGFKGTETYIIDQFYHKNIDDNKTIIEYKKDITDFCNKVYYEYKVKTYIYCEYSPKTLYNLLNANNDLDLKISLNKVDKSKVDLKSKNAIKERIEITNILINSNNLFIYDKEMQVYNAMANAVWKNNDERLDDGSTDIDSLDAFEYAIKSEFKYYYKNLMEEV